jgi:DinB family protein
MTELETAIAENRAAVGEFMASAQALDGPAWTRARAQGAWTPAQIVEHIVLAYEYSRDVVLGTATGGVPRLFRPLLRRLVVDSTLKAGKFTRKGRAPAVFRPSDTPQAKSELLDRLHRAVAAFESAIRSQHPEARHTVTHPAFGVVPTVDYVRLQAIHARHHRAQLS